MISHISKKDKNFKISLYNIILKENIITIITKKNFLKSIVKGIEFKNFFEFLKQDIKDISYISFKETYIQGNRVFGSRSSIYFKNCLVHNNINYAYRYKYLNAVEIYFFNGIQYCYEDWIYLPERLREIRNEKLKLL